ncbi:MAG: YncE family protein [Candidatus Binatia bacterium]
MNGESIGDRRAASCALVVFTLALATMVTVRPATAITIGMVTDAATNQVTVFNADTDTILGSVAVPGSLADCAISVDKRVGYVTVGDSQLFQIDLTQNPPVLRSGVNPIAISNDGTDVSLSPRGEYALVCSEADPPVSVVLTQKRIEIGTFALDSDCSSVDACPNARSNNSSVLVTAVDANYVRRLRLDTSGKLVDTGDVLGGGSPGNVTCSPLGTAGVALHQSPFEIQSFTIPGLAPVDTRTLTGGVRPISAVFNPSGTLVYVKGGAGGAGTVDVFAFDQTTGALGATPVFSIPIAATTTQPFGTDIIALNPAGTKLYVSEPGALNVYNAATGALITSITSADIVNPFGVCIR